MDEDGLPKDFDMDEDGLPKGFDMGEDGLPTDFDINANIPTLTLQIKKVPMCMYYHNYIMRMEKEKAERDGRTYGVFTCD